MISTQELKSLSLKELQEELKKAQNEAMKVRVQISTGHEKNTSKKRNSRLAVARIKTAIKEAEMEAQNNSEKN